MNRVPITVEGAEKLTAELNHLKKVERPNVIEAISEARAHGDLKENAEYHAAREKQSFLEGRIADLEGQLSNAQVIDVTKINNTGKVIFGSTVELINDDTDEKVVYQIVGEYEADIKQKKISISSPIARAIIGKEEGDEVIVNTPSGEVAYVVDQVLYV